MTDGDFRLSFEPASPRHEGMKPQTAHWLRWVCRYPLAVLLIPVGVALGTAGLLHHWIKKLQGR